MQHKLKLKYLKHGVSDLTYHYVYDGLRFLKIFLLACRIQTFSTLYIIISDLSKPVKLVMPKKKPPLITIKHPQNIDNYIFVFSEIIP